MDPEGFMEQFEASLSEANVQETDEEVEAEEVEDAAETPFRHADTLSTYYITNLIPRFVYFQF